MVESTAIFMEEKFRFENLEITFRMVFSLLAFFIVNFDNILKGSIPI